MKSHYLICQHTFLLLKECIKNKDNTINDCESLLQKFNETHCTMYGFKPPQLITLPFKPPFDTNNHDEWCFYLSSIFN